MFVKIVLQKYRPQDQEGVLDLSRTLIVINVE